MKKVIITGANGFLGTMLCKELSDLGVQIIAIVKNEESDYSDIKELSGVRILFSEMSGYKDLPDLIRDQDVDVFYHLAWQGTSGELRGNEDVQIKNIAYTCDAVKACAAIGCKRFVFASSIMEYEIEALMGTEHTPGINTLYSSAKAAANHMARTLAGNKNIDYIRAVISNIYGPGEKSARLISSSLQKMLRGEHCSFSAGEQMYDFIYITDAAKAFVAVGEKGKTNRTYYIGSPEPRPLKEFLREMSNCVDPSIVPGLGEVPFGGGALHYDEFDLDSVYKDTGFTPAIGFKQGISNTINWLRGRDYGI